MFPSVALYYPYIHFRDARWLKTAVLLWDEVARIVPQDFRLDDDPEVQELGEYVRNIDPSFVTEEIARELESFLRDNIDRLGNYTVTDLQDEQLGFLYHTKIRYGLAGRLQEARLARLERSGNPNWVGLHPAIAAVYMSAMANHLARRNQLEPITSDEVAFCSLGGIKECAEGILEGDFTFRSRRRPAVMVRGDGPARSSITKPEILTCIFTGFEIAEAADLPAKKLAKFLEKHPNEKIAFRHYVQDLRTALIQFSEIEDPKLQQEEISRYLNFNSTNVIDSYREQLRDAGIQTVAKLLAFRVPVGAAITALSGSLGWGALATGAAIFKDVHDYRAKKRQLMRSNAAASYLLNLQREVTYEQFTTRLKQIFSRNRERAQIITLGL